MDTVSVAVTLEAIALAYIWYRNTLNDRINVITHIPLLIKDVLVALLATEIADDDLRYTSRFTMSSI